MPSTYFPLNDGKSQPIPFVVSDKLQRSVRKKMNNFKGLSKFDI